MKIPEYVVKTIDALKQGRFEAYIVGGCVRDFLMGKEPKDWDITTNAKPEEILKIFVDAKYENDFGTVLLPIREVDKLIDVLEITTYRSEQGYSDRRHPDEVCFEEKLDKDLERRDFTINALALDPAKPEEVVDYFGGRKDIKQKIIRAVGEPSDRFKEDALRMLRAVRFSSQLGFELEPKTQRGILKLAGSLKFVSKERIKDEMIKILASDRPYEGIMLLHDCKLLQYILPELEQGVDVKQDRHHIYNVFRHNVLALKHCPSKEWQVRFAALLHDVAKPKTRKIINNIATFYNHEYLGAKMTDKIMTRLKFSNDDRVRVVNLVKNHMFYYNVGEVSAASVRRLIVKVGRENLKDLIDLRIADRLGSGTPKAMPYKLRHLQYMMEKVQNDPISVKMLKINGDDLMKVLGIAPGPKIGAILDVLLSEVIENPELNEAKLLAKQAQELDKLNLEELRARAKEVIEEKRQEEDRDIKKQYKV
ncbi:MAG TPA: CCA tRNA nucleotidyltransferase [Candidatus Saccharimonadales bacterium]|nr:CCA tRNA nucleotidyltransferase [Candidatus Saccharimonadales bacterium]